MNDPIAPEGLRGVDAADVYKSGVLAGSIHRERDDSVFAYMSGYLADHAAPQIAVTLPKRAEPVRATAGAVPPFFAGLLPEGVRLTAITTATRTSADDHLTLLLAVGADTIGDVQVVPAGVRPAATAHVVDEGSIARGSLAQVFARATSTSPAAYDRVGLPGVQAKVSASMMSTPLATTAGPAILKLNPPSLPRLVENEAFFLGMARAAGITVPEHRIVRDRDGQAGLLVARFDRVVGHGTTLRLPQEDACQLLGRYPAGKYRIKLEEAITALGDAVASGGGSAPLAVRKALEIAAFSYLIGNGDLHGKNLSVRRNTDRLWELTPAYDLLTTQPYLAWRDPMALSLFGRANRLTRRWWLDAAGRLGIPERALGPRLDQLAAVADTWAERVADIGFDDRTADRLSALIHTRGAELAR